MRNLLAFLLSCSVCLGQGFTLRDVGFVGGVVAGGSAASGGDSVTAPTAFWDLEETTGNRLDAVGSLDLVPSGTGPDYDTGLLGNALKMLAGTSQPSAKVSLEDSTSFATDGSDISLAFWIKAAASATPQIYFEINDSGGSLVAIISYYYSGTTLIVETWNNDPFTEAKHEFALHAGRDSNWHLVVISYEESSGKLFFSEDGDTPTGTAGGFVLVGDVKGSVIIRSANTNQYMIDSFGLWIGHVLTSSEITTLYNSGAGKAYADL